LLFFRRRRCREVARTNDSVFTVVLQEHAVVIGIAFHVKALWILFFDTILSTVYKLVWA
jgi:hypothetical protein